MATQSPDEERQWAAEKRDFVADRRDELAAKRDAVADARDAVADERQRELDTWERQLQAQATELGHGADDAVAAAQRAEAAAGRERARRDRVDEEVAREAAAADRDDAARRRLKANPSTRLASAFAEIAEQLYAADSFDEVLQRIAETTVGTVAGCDMASITVRQRGTYLTAATTAAAASAVDQAQYDANEGPCLEAFETPIVYAPAFPDTRWPTLSTRPAELGAQSIVSFQLDAASLANADTGGSLNAYGGEPDAFTDEAKNIGLILAAHASMAAGAAHQRRALQDLAVNLNKALLSRDVIGQAKGILMERCKMTPEDAFDALRQASQRLNEKLHAVAARLAETGEFITGDAHTEGAPNGPAGAHSSPPS
jgi:hypothetical protein